MYFFQSGCVRQCSISMPSLSSILEKGNNSSRWRFCIMYMYVFEFCKRLSHKKMLSQAGRKVNYAISCTAFEVQFKKKSLNSDITCYLLWSRITQCSKFLENQHFGCTIVLLYLSLTFILCFLYSYFGIYFCFVVFSGWGLYCIRSPYFVTTILWQIHYKAYAKKMRGLTFTLGKCFLHSVLLLILELMGFFAKS